jgi:hypothetical protein
MAGESAASLLPPLLPGFGGGGGGASDWPDSEEIDLVTAIRRAR